MNERAEGVREAARYIESIHRRGLINMATVQADLEAAAHRMENGMTARGNTRAAGGVSPNAPDEREALATAVLDGLLASTTVPFTRESAAVMWVVESVERAGFRRSREATTEPQPEPEWEYGVDDRGMHPEGHVWLDRGEKRPINLEVTLESSGRLRRWYGLTPVYRRRKAGQWEQFAANEDEARAALEAVEASRSPKPTGGSDG